MSNTELRKHELTPGQVAERAGVSVSALHFYEREGLVSSVRTAGNQRRYHRDVLRRVAFIRVSQRVGISLAEIKAALESLPDGKTPTKADWARLSRRWRDDLDTRIDQLQRLRAGLDGCIGCGCLSLRTCTLNNPDDALGRTGPGPRRLLSETADEAEAVVDELHGGGVSTGYGSEPRPARYHRHPGGRER